MNRFAVMLLAAAVGTPATAPRAAGFDFGLGLFKKKPKAEPPTRVKQLVATLQTDPDEKARLAAAEELRSFDPRTNPEMLSALTGTLQRDPSAAVRAGAAETLGRLKPVDQPTGLALEAAQEGDPAASVREAAKSALWQYHLNGYRSAGVVADTRGQTAEPPLAARRTPGTTVSNSKAGGSKAAASTAEPGFRPITNGAGRNPVFYQTGEPPLAKPKTAAKPAAAPALVSTPSAAPVSVPAPPAPAPEPAVKPAPVAASFPMAMPSAPAPEPSSPIPSVGAPALPTPTYTPPAVPTFTPPPAPGFPTLPPLPGN